MIKGPLMVNVENESALKRRPHMCSNASQHLYNEQLTICMQSKPLFNIMIHLFPEHSGFINSHDQCVFI